MPDADRQPSHRQKPLQFEILGPDRLRQLDLAGKPILSDLPYELQSNGTLEPMDVSLINTYWRIVRMQGDEIKPAPGRREPHLLFRQSEAGPSYAATVGCNQLVGQLKTKGDHLSFSRGATTLMACPPPLAGLEKQLGEVLNGTRRWVILGNTLSLQNKAGKELALFEAVYF